MKKLADIVQLLLSPLHRARALRDDENGQVVVLSAVMAFVVLIMTIMSVNTGRAIYNRILAQNSVDAAASAAALWQARGCNLLQHLNNLHYNGNRAAYIAESAALVGCVVAPALQALIWLIGPAPYAAACVACVLAPGIDRAQEIFNDAITNMRKPVPKVFPVLAFLYGNVAAQGSGADRLIGSIEDYAGELLDKIGLGLPGFDAISGALSGMLDSIPIYAVPLDPTSLKLHMETESPRGLPWYYPNGIAAGAAGVGAAACPGFNFNMPNRWGWRNSYMKGNPGFMTWVAGKEGRRELLGLGNLTWLATRTELGEAAMEDASKRMYTPNSVRLGNAELKIPGFIAFASSQVNGDTVVGKGSVNADPVLITVQFPPEGSGVKGDKFMIWH